VAAAQWATRPASANSRSRQRQSAKRVRS
jgi:hypothetical protein